MDKPNSSAWHRLTLSGGAVLYEQMLLLADEFPGLGVISEGDQVQLVLPPDLEQKPLLGRVEETLRWMIEEDLAAKQSLVIDLLPEEDWVARWRESLGPVRAGERFVILPPGVEAEIEPGEIVLNLEPRMAFGTGDHATTRMALALLEPVAANATHVLDLGCGNGVLAIGAALLGAKKVTAIDHEEESYDETLENAENHGVLDRMAVLRGDAIAFTPKEPVDLLLANIFVNPILQGLGHWLTCLTDEATLVFTGVQEGEEEHRLLAGCREHGLELDELRREAGWIAARFKRHSA